MLKKKSNKIKLKIKKKIDVDYNPFLYGTPPEIIQAAYAEIGERYLNLGGQNCLVITSKDTKQSSDVRKWELEYYAVSNEEDMVSEFKGIIRGNTPLIPYKNYIGIGGVEMLKKTKVETTKSGEKKVKVTGTVSKAKVAAGKKLAAKAKEGIDPKIGAKPGTDAYEIGKIMLGIKEGAEHRAKSMTKIVAYLQDKGFDEKKSKTLGASWYSTLVNRKPDIYGKFKKSK